MSIDRVFVIGAGLMGHGIAQVSAAAGKHGDALRPHRRAGGEGQGPDRGNLARQVEKGKLEQPTADEIIGRIGTSEGTDGAAGHDIVIEAVFEDESVKRDTWQALTSAADADAIFASNTSSISITSLATATDRPPRFIGLHFFSPVPVMGLIEIIRGLETDDATYRRVQGVRRGSRQDGDRVARLSRLPGEPDARAVHQRGGVRADGVDRHRRGHRHRARSSA